MKKFFLSTAVVAAMAIGYTFSYSDSEPALSDIELANVEALADNEDVHTQKFKCYTSFVYSAGDAVIDCSTCMRYEDHKDALFNFHDFCIL